MWFAIGVLTGYFGHKYQDRIIVWLKKAVNRGD